MYNEFIEKYESLGYEFPCTKSQFIARASEFCAGDEQKLDSICSQGIGSNWAE